MATASHELNRQFAAHALEMAVLRHQREAVRFGEGELVGVIEVQPEVRVGASEGGLAGAIKLEQREVGEAIVEEVLEQRGLSASEGDHSN